jgi:serine/threonine-protein kinase OSR1/STK39
MKSWPTDAAGYTLSKQIGNGSFSAVWKAQVAGTGGGNGGAGGGSEGELVSIKIMDLENVGTSFDDILQEVQTMTLSDDRNVLRCYCSFVSRDQLWLVTQYMAKGSCLRVMTLGGELYGLGRGLCEEALAYILRETLKGLHYLHASGQIHRDIKCGNILLDAEGAVRLADFGVSGWTLSRGQRRENVRTFVGTPCWMAPEVMEQVDGYDHRADIWSIGITALELAKGTAPYAKYAPMRVLVLTIEEDPPGLKSYENDKQASGAPFSRLFEEFYKKCLQKNPRLRLSAEELLKLKFFKNRDKSVLVSQYLDHIPSVGEEPEEAPVAELEEFLQEAGGGEADMGRGGALGGAGGARPAEAQELGAAAAQAGADGSASAPASKSDHVFHPAVASAVASVVDGDEFDNSATLSTNPLSNDKKAVEPSSGKVDYVAGTTWVFDDFSTADGELVVGGGAAEGGAGGGGEGTSEIAEKELDTFMEDLEGIVDI